MTPNQWIERWFQKLWNEGQSCVIEEMVASDGVISGLPGGPYRGHQAIKQYHLGMLASFSDFDLEINEAMEWGQQAMARVHLNLTHTASGHRAGLECACWIRLNDGLLVEGRNYIDFLALLQQLGLTSGDAFQAAVAQSRSIS